MGHKYKIMRPEHSERPELCFSLGGDLSYIAAGTLCTAGHCRLTAAGGDDYARGPRRAPGSPRGGVRRGQWGRAARASRPPTASSTRRAGGRRQEGPTSGGSTRQRQRCGERGGRAGREVGRGGARRSKTPRSSGHRPRRQGRGAAAGLQLQARGTDGVCAAQPGGARHHQRQRPQGGGHRRASGRRRGWHRSTTFPHVARRYARSGRVGGGHRG